MSGIVTYGQDAVVDKIYSAVSGVNYTSISISASGASEIVSAISTRTIRVVSLHAIAAGPVNVKWQSAANDLTGLAYFAANGGYVLPFNAIGWFQTNASEALNISLSAATGVGGSLAYVVI